VFVAASGVVMVTPPFLTVDLNDPFSLNCTVMGQPMTQTRWLMKGISLGVNGPVYMVARATKSDAGNYSCQFEENHAQSIVVVQCT